MSNMDGGPGTGLGGSLGARVAELVARATVSTRSRLAPHTRAVALSVMGDFTDLMSDEAREALGPLLEQLASDPQVGPQAQALVRFLARRRGQWQMLAASTTTGAAMGGGLLNLVTNELNPAILRLIGANPNGVLTPTDAALATARNIPGPPTWKDEAAAGGINERRFNAMVELNRTLPALGELLEGVNRGLFTLERAVRTLQRAGFRNEDIPSLMELRHRELTPEQLADAWNRSVVTTAQGRELAARSGMRAEDFDRLTEIGGQPLGIQDLLTAQRRGIIDAERARRGWVQGPVRNEWFDVAQELQYSPMSTVDAADAVNQGILDEAAGRRIAEENGLRAADFDTLIKAAGLPPGVELATEALNRGLLTEGQFRTAFLESRLKNRYVELYMQLRYRVMPQETVLRLYRTGVFTRDQTVVRLGWAGYSPQDSAALVASVDAGASDSTVELTKTEVLSLYADRVVNEASARGMLTTLGLSEGEVELLLTLADARRERKYVDAVTTRVRAGYVAGRLDQTEASGLLDRLRVPVRQRDDLFTLWDLERDANTRGLTVAQVQAALKRGLIDAPGALSRLAWLGYSPEDANILVALVSAAPQQP